MKEPALFWTTSKKIAATVILGFIYWLMVANFSSCSEQRSFSSLDGPEVTVIYLQDSYRSYNDQYFQNRLPSVTITTDLGGENMAMTDCKNDDGTDCTMQFNLHYAAAQRVALDTELHEMCHIEVWSQALEINKPPFKSKLAYDHGRPWHACMERLYASGVFHDLIVDNYDGDQ